MGLGRYTVRERDEHGGPGCEVDRVERTDEVGGDLRKRRPEKRPGNQIH